MLKESCEKIIEEKNVTKEKVKKVECPVCSNRRLFDMINADQAELEIKCPKCGSKIHVSFVHNQINARAM